MVVGCHQQPTIVASFFDNGGCTLMATNPTKVSSSGTGSAFLLEMAQAICVSNSQKLHLYNQPLELGFLHRSQLKSYGGENSILRA
jgi:hypothetical protein